jgi:hypothetical protein
VPYFKCVPCKIRVSESGASTAHTDGACPDCGSRLEPVAELTEVVGFRSPNLLDLSVPPGQIDRWLDEGGSLGAEPVAEAVALDLLHPGSR